MIRHVVLFTWTPEATPEQLAAVAAGLASLPGQIPGVRAYHFGTDAGLVDGHDRPGRGTPLLVQRR